MGWKETVRREEGMKEDSEERRRDERRQSGKEKG